jgi:hypothetical protein
MRFLACPVKKAGRSAVIKIGARDSDQKNADLARTLDPFIGLTVMRPEDSAVKKYEATMLPRSWFYQCERQTMGEQAVQCGHRLPNRPLRL